MNTRLSGYQYSMLKLFLSQPGRNKKIDLETAGQLKQTSLGGLKRRGYLAVSPDHQEIVLTPDAVSAMKEFEDADILRRVASLKLSTYFELYENGNEKRGRKR